MSDVGKKVALKEHGLKPESFRLDIDGKMYKTVEHYFQSKRQPTDDFADKVLQTPTANDAKKLNTKLKKLLKSTLSQQDESKLMLKGLRAKFSQNEDLKKALLSTGYIKLHEGAGRSGGGRWGLRKDKSEGGDELGRLLTIVRSELQTQQQELDQ